MRWQEDIRYTIPNILTDNIPQEDRGKFQALVGRDPNGIQYRPIPYMDSPQFVAREGEIHRCCYRIITQGGTNTCNACEDSAKELIRQVNAKHIRKVLVHILCVGIVTLVFKRVMAYFDMI
jgi:hypothetical protein